MQVMILRKNLQNFMIIKSYCFDDEELKPVQYLTSMGFVKLSIDQ